MKPSDLFLKLSCLLTGVKELDSQVAEHYRTLLLSRFGPGYLDELLAAYALGSKQKDPLDSLQKRIAADSSRRLASVAKQVVRLWYFSQFNDPDQGGRPSNAGFHAKALAWPLIKVHPPAYSTSPHGYWTAKPK